MSKWGRDPDEINRDVHRALIMAEYDDYDRPLDAMRALKDANPDVRYH